LDYGGISVWGAVVRLLHRRIQKAGSWEKEKERGKERKRERPYIYIYFARKSLMRSRLRGNHVFFYLTPGSTDMEGKNTISGVLLNFSNILFQPSKQL